MIDTVHVLWVAAQSHTASFGVKDLPLVGVRLLVGLVELGG